MARVPFRIILIACRIPCYALTCSHPTPINYTPTGGIRRRHVEGSRNCGSDTCSFKSHQRKRERSRERQRRTCKRLADCNERNNRVGTELRHHKKKEARNTPEHPPEGGLPGAQKMLWGVTKPENSHFVT
jgi:hypothetical protein